jgi:predicted glycosyltransferase
MSKAALMYCCQSAPGAGHVQRALAVADELSEQFKVTMLLNEPASKSIQAPDNVNLVFLQALSADPESNVNSLSETGERQQRSLTRRDTMLRVFDELRPRVVAIDSFPFNQYRLRSEFLPLIESARNGRYGESLVACITDGILANNLPNNEAHADKAADLLDRYFDITIVRSDPVFARLEEFFQPKNTVHTPLYHAGFVVQHRSNLRPLPSISRKGILVSAGDGSHGTALYKSAIEAHRTLQQTLPVPMTIIAGERLPENDWRALQSLAEGLPKLSLKRTSIDSVAEMAAVSWSVSQCEYNTAVDAIRTRTPSLFVPSTDTRSREQIERAKRLVYWGAGRLLMHRHLNSASLVNEIHQLTKFESREMHFDMHGAHNAAQLIAQIVYHNNYTPISARPSTDTRLH